MIVLCVVTKISPKFVDDRKLTLEYGKMSAKIENYYTVYSDFYWLPDDRKLLMETKGIVKTYDTNTPW